MQRFLSFTQDMRGALLMALFGTYFGSLWVAALNFPHAYDWRRNAISNLLSPRDNPGWHWLPSAGLVMAALFMLWLAIWIESELHDGDSRLARRVRRPAFLVGIVCLILAAIVAPQHAQTLAGMRHVHEMLARTSAVGLGVAMLCACRGTGLAKMEVGQEVRLRVLRGMWRAITLPPIAGAATSGLVVGLARLHGLAAGPAAFFRGTMFWHLAFWEWTGSVTMFLFFASAVLTLNDKHEAQRL